MFQVKLEDLSGTDGVTLVLRSYWRNFMFKEISLVRIAKGDGTPEPSYYEYARYRKKLKMGTMLWRGRRPAFSCAT